MQVRITIDFQMTIIAAEAVTLHGPYHICPKGAENISGLVGLTIGPGWKRKVQNAIGGPKGCTHITELMGPMAAIGHRVASRGLGDVYKRQLYGEKARQRRASGADEKQQITTPLPSLTNSCIAYAEDSER